MFIRKYMTRLLFLVILTTFLIPGCRPRKEIQQEIRPRAVSSAMVLNSLHENQFDFSWFSARFSGSVLFDNRTTSISGNLRIERDKALFVSIAPVLGIEVVRALITPDSVKIINRLDGTYYLGGLDILNKMFSTDVDFLMLQALFTANDFPHFQNDNFDLSEENQMLRMHNRNRRKVHGGGTSFNQSMLLNPETFRIHTNIIVDERNKRSLRADYRSFERVSQQLIPSDLQIVFSDAAAMASLNMQFSRITINDPKRMDFSVPARYKPLEID
jgi:hypothetical protein